MYGITIQQPIFLVFQHRNKRVITQVVVGLICKIYVRGCSVLLRPPSEKVIWIMCIKIRRYL